MAARPASVCFIVCDGCGAETVALVMGSTAARLAAARDGWKFAEYNTTGLNRYAPVGTPKERRKVMPRQWDCCPACELPADAVAAYEIRQARNGATS